MPRGAGVPRLCIVSLYSYPLYNPAYQALFGGAEVRAALIARELAKRGQLDVSVVVFDHGQPHVEHRGDITLYSHPGYPAPVWSVISRPPSRRRGLEVKEYLRVLRHRGSHWLKYYFPRFWRWLWERFGQPSASSDPDHQDPQVAGYIGEYAVKSSRIAVYDEVNADIYMSFSNSDLAAEIAFYCKQRGRIHVFSSGCDEDYKREYKEKPKAASTYGPPGYVMAFAVENATVHIVQNETQRRMLKENYNRPSIMIRNPVDLERAFPKEADSILWIGKSDRVKRPDIMLELAREFPRYPFVMIMNLSHPDLHKRYTREAEALPNVTMLHYVPYLEVERYFARAKLFVNTSTFEGFPNTFLEAGKYEIPIVSYLVDPGGMLSQHGCGLLCEGDFERLKESVRQLMTGSSLYADMGARCLEYVHTYHDKEKVIKEYEKAILAARTFAERERQ